LEFTQNVLREFGRRMNITAKYTCAYLGAMTILYFIFLLPQSLHIPALAVFVLCVMVYAKFIVLPTLKRKINRIRSELQKQFTTNSATHTKNAREAKK
jgi:hypothetical protein